MRNIVIFLLFNFCILNSFGQYAVNTLAEYTTINKQFTPFPQIQTDGVDLYSGKLNLSYSLLGGVGQQDLNNIFLSYSGGGVRVNEEASEIGLGWSIYTHATISREVRGLGDFEVVAGENHGFINTSISLPTYNSFFTTELQNILTEHLFNKFTDDSSIATTFYDTEPDVFTLNLGDRSVTFVLPQRLGSNLITAKLLNKEDKIKIFFDVQNTNFTVIDEYGTQYLFDIKDYTVSSSKSSNMGPNYDELYRTSTFQTPLLTNWHVSRMKKINNEEFLYTYQKVNKGESPSSSHSYSVVACIDGMPDKIYGNGETTYTVFINESVVHQLKKIVFPNGYVDFLYSNRTDLPICGSLPYYTDLLKQSIPGGSTTTNFQKLDKIQLFNKSGAVIKEISFNFSYFNQGKTFVSHNSKELRLKLDKALIGPEEFSFVYNKSDSLPDKLSWSMDYLGFFNGRLNPTLIPSNHLRYWCSASIHCNSCFRDIYSLNPDKRGNRTPSLNHAKIGNLTEVRSKIGKVTKIDYELNNFLLSKSDTVNSGYDFDSEKIEEYVAQYASTTVQTDVFTVSQNSGVYIDYQRICGGDFNKPQGESHYKCELEFEDTQQIAYEIVNANTNAVVRTLYHSSPDPTTDQSLAPGQYFVRFKSLKDPWNTINLPGSPDHGKLYYFAAKVILRKSQLEQNGGWLNVNFAGLRVKSIKYYDNNNLEIQKDYEYNEFGSNKSSGNLSHPYINYYDRYVSQSHSHDIQSLPSHSTQFFTVNFTSDINVYGGSQPKIGYSNVREYYKEGANFNGYTDNIFYNLRNEYAIADKGSHKHLFPTFEEDIHKATYNFYPLKSFYHINGKLKKRNFFNQQNQLLEQESFVYESNQFEFGKAVLNGGKVSSFTIENYNDIGELAKRDVKLVTYQPYLIYDNTNPLVKKIRITNSNSLMVLKEESWAYNSVNYNLSNYSLRNSDNNVFKTTYLYPNDLQASGRPNMNILIEKNVLFRPIETSNYFNDKLINKVAFEYSLFHQKFIFPSKETHFLDGIQVGKQFLFDYEPNSGNVISIVKVNGPSTVYLWGYGGQYPIAKIENASYAEVQQVLTASEINSLNLPAVSDATVQTITSKLRNSALMKTALVTSYTYKPLIGMTSKTDPRGITEHYEYDGFQRLKDVLDFEKNVLTDYQYHYRP
ncbi:hypothetical protein [Sphingobacterium endophyticum]|uniref:hypothetical protein n=1 Tax=Sphingobacterium endophyticum TaxID=2546448 RepID=UPI0012E1C864|nr:hypothetical protein [Sphingobacterium endophyticum]